MTLALCTDGISKEFRGGRRAVDALSLSVASAQVYGFLGPNGAGKTTTIRILLDLVRPSHGKAYLFGKDPRRDRSALRRVGALVEGAAFYPYLSGRINLELLRRMNGGKSRPIDELLERVGLKSHADDRFGSYSTGMKQRLGIAAALLHDPDLVILDEPTNGLDPVGMVEMRDLIRSLVDRDGKTVFLSSHLLGEVEQICDRVAIIDQGHLLREGTIPDLLEGRGGSVRIEVDNVESALAALDKNWRGKTLTPSPSHSGRGENAEIEVTASREDIPDILSRLIRQGVGVYSVMPHRHSLEDLFLMLVGKTDEASEANQA
jgi:ABC-2 type transport system ATP-binding protein